MTAESLYRCKGFREGLTFLIVSARFSYHWAGSGITYQQMLILNTLASLPLCQGFNTKWGLPCLFNYSQNRTMAHKKFAEGGSCVCVWFSKRNNSQDSYCLIKWSGDYSGTVNFGYHASDDWINSSINKYRISSVIHSDLQFDSACKLRFDFSSIP